MEHTRSLECIPIALLQMYVRRGSAVSIEKPSNAPFLDVAISQLRLLEYIESPQSEKIFDFAIYRPDGLIVDCGLTEHPSVTECYRVVLRSPDAWQREKWVGHHYVYFGYDRPISERSITLTSKGLAASESVMSLENAWHVWMDGCDDPTASAALIGWTFAGMDSMGSQKGNQAGHRESPHDHIAVDSTEVEILKVLADSPSRMTQADVAAAVGYSRRTIQDKLVSLESSGFVIKHSRGTEISPAGRRWLLEKGLRSD